MIDLAPQDTVATAQIIGDRDNQEDSLAMHSIESNASMHAGERLLLLADGMGGHAGGEVASSLVVTSFAEAYINSQARIMDALRSSLDSANDRLADVVAEMPKLICRRKPGLAGHPGEFCNLGYT